MTTFASTQPHLMPRRSLPLSRYGSPGSLTAIVLFILACMPHRLAAQDEWQSIPDSVRWPDGQRGLNLKLSHACKAGSYDSVVALLERGANPNGEYPGNRTPLMMAVRRRSHPIVKLLLARGADVNARNVGGETVLWYAARTNDPAGFRLLVDAGAIVDVVDDQGDPLIASVAEMGRTEILRYLLERGVPPDLPMKNSVWTGHTPLMRAARYGHVDCVKLLLANGANPNARNRNGQGPLSVAASPGPEDRANCEQIVRILIDAGAVIDAPDNYGRTALIFSVLGNCNDSITAILLAAGANPSIKDNDGDSAISLAAEYGCSLGRHEPEINGRGD